MQEGLKPVPSAGKLVENKIQMFSLGHQRARHWGYTNAELKKIREYIKPGAIIREHESEDFVYWLMSWRFIYFPGFNPVWDAEKFSKDLLMPELVMIRFAVFDEDVGIVDDFIGQFSLPYTSLRPGNCAWEGDNLKDLNSLIKYRDLSLESRSIIGRSRRQISIFCDNRVQ